MHIKNCSPSANLYILGRGKWKHGLTASKKIYKVTLMAKPRVKEQMEKVDAIAGSYRELASSLSLHRALLEALRPLDESEGRGASKNLDWSILSSLVERSLKEKKHLGSYVDSSAFDPAVFKDTFLRVLDVLQGMHPSEGELALLSDVMENGKMDAVDAIRALLNEDASWLKKKGLELGVDPSLLLSVLELPLRPFFEELARRFEDAYIEDWWEPHCPICGRKPPTGRMRGKKLYLVCAFCGDRYAADLFQCISCGNKDPTKLAFISPEGHPELEIQYCEVCKTYIKVVNEDKPGGVIPLGLEDVLTRGLDDLAQLPELGLRRY